jgi:hypothetical protein
MSVPVRPSLFVCALLIAAPPLAAQSVPSRVRLSGTIRTRYEALGGQARAGFNASDDLFNLRTTLRADYDPGPVQLVAELWDSRVYGGRAGTPVTTGEVNTLEFVQAYAEARLGAVAGPGSQASIQAGRFLLNLGSRRLVAADDYRNTTNGYTGLRADLQAKAGWHATAIYTLPQMRRPDDLPALRDNRVGLDRESFDLVLWGGLVSRARAFGAVTAELSFFHLGERDAPRRPTRDRSLDTIGLRLVREPAPARTDFEVEGFAQWGEVSTSTAATAPRQQVRAWFVHADLGYTFAAPWQPHVAIEYDQASGDGRGGRFGRFDTLFGMRRADLAPSGLYNAVGRANIASPGLRLEAAPGPGTDGLITYRPMWLAARYDSFSTTGVRDASGRSGRFAGHQVDARIRHRLTRRIRLEADAVLLRKGRFLRDAPNAPAGGWTRYVAFNATAAF